jgi:RNA polymerase sigma-70 factor (ECF subfamily)
MPGRPSNAEDAAWQRHRDALYHFVLRRVQDHAAAEDIVQDILVKAYTRKGTLRDASKWPWLYQITRNAIVDHYRLQKPAEAMADELMDPRTTEDGNRAQRELAGCLLPLLEELPEGYREALRLADFEGVTQRETASRLGLSLTGAKSRVQRARKMLRASLLKCCQVELDRRGGVVDYQAREGCDHLPCAPHSDARSFRTEHGPSKAQSGS